MVTGVISLPTVWPIGDRHAEISAVAVLLAAALYATVALFLEHALYEKALMAQTHETVRAKQPARALDLNAAKPAPPGGTCHPAIG